VYGKKPRTTVDLKQNIPEEAFFLFNLLFVTIRPETREEVAAISPNMLQRVMQNFQKRLGECVDNKGRHLTNTIFRK
jgi:hypothetical protein